MQPLATRRAAQRGALLLAVVGLAACAKGKDPPAPTAKVLIQGGAFSMGTDQIDPCGNSRIRNNMNVLTCDGLTQSAAIQHTANVNTFCIDAHEVTNLQYRHCVEREECNEPESTNVGNQGQEGFIKSYYSDPDKYGGFPVVGITHANALQYCESKGGTLPTEVQWEFAASSRGATDGAAPIWVGSDLTDAFLAGTCDGQLSAQPCGERVLAAGTASGDRTAEGVMDMAGNVREWVRDEFDYLAGCEQDGIEDQFRIDGTRAVFKEDQGNPPAGLISDPACFDNGDEGYAGGCDPAFFTCLRVCTTAFAGGTAVPVQEKLDRYHAENCEARFGRVGLVADPNAVSDSDICETECTGNGGEAEECLRYCTCLAGERKDQDFTSTACIQTCFGDYRGCADGCESGVQATCMHRYPEDSQQFLPAPVCQPRTRDGETAHERPEAFDVDPLTNAYVVRGGAFDSEALCDARVSRRDMQRTSSPFIGFRCVFPASACQ